MKPADLSATSPRLSTSLTGPRSINQCQACGGSLTFKKVWGWIEHDHHDRPEPFSVWLCEKCSKRLIEPHPRLYRQLMPHEPFPGAMPICLDCKYRDGVTCRSPLAVFNGGAEPGIKYTYPPATQAHINRGSKGGSWVRFYSGPVTACSGKST